MYWGSEEPASSANGELKVRYNESAEFRFNPNVVKSAPTASIVRSLSVILIASSSPNRPYLEPLEAVVSGASELALGLGCPVDPLPVLLPALPEILKPASVSPPVMPPNEPTETLAPLPYPTLPSPPVPPVLATVDVVTGREFPLLPAEPVPMADWGTLIE